MDSGEDIEKVAVVEGFGVVLVGIYSSCSSCSESDALRDFLNAGCGEGLGADFDLDSLRKERIFTEEGISVIFLVAESTNLLRVGFDLFLWVVKV